MRWRLEDQAPKLACVTLSYTGSLNTVSKRKRKLVLILNNFNQKQSLHDFTETWAASPHRSLSLHKSPAQWWPPYQCPSSPVLRKHLLNCFRMHRATGQKQLLWGHQLIFQKGYSDVLHYWIPTASQQETGRMYLSRKRNWRYLEVKRTAYENMAIYTWKGHHSVFWTQCHIQHTMLSSRQWGRTGKELHPTE